MATNSEDYKVKLKKDRKVRLEKTALHILQGMVGYELWANTHDDELVEQSIRLAKEFIRQMDSQDVME